MTTVTEEGAGALLRTDSGGALRVSFLDARTVRVEAVADGVFTDPANTPEGDETRTSDIVVGSDSFTAPEVTVDDGTVIRISTDEVTLEVTKADGLMTMLRHDGSVVWSESSPLSFGTTSTTQHLAEREGEQFLGGGMQNGRSIHTGETVNISKNFDWDDNGHPNAVPYYMSNQGYGVLRNTFARGTYVFDGNPTATHEEERFDAYYFVGDYKQALNGYTELTGRPLMPPVYALEYGDADCYNRSNPDYDSSGFGDPDNAKQHTIDAAKIAAQFEANDMPAAWMLVNDGYGCEYSNLPEAVDAIAEHDLKTGLWTQRSLTEQESEVGDAGIRLRKLDVAWVGEGYRMALTGCEAAHDGIEQYSDARGTALMVEGWAGAQRCGMQWTGDHTGNLDAVRWQVSALTGAGNSGMPFTTGDVDGIFGGSATSYVRDLQWKAFAPALYSMSGWANVDKRPWLYGEDATAINRSYLQLRQKLMPFIYTLAAEAHRNGTPMMRSLALEYPDDPMAYSEEANTEFLLGSDFLVAPVFSDTSVRNGIYLPEGRWVDYWSGQIYEGGRVVNGYSAPLDTLPVFVRAGAVIPQGIVARNASLVPEGAPITLDVYPQGDSTFSLYEDDEVTRAYKDGASSTQKFDITAPAKDGGDVSIRIGARDGEYAGKAASRGYRLDVHTGSAPSEVTRDGVALTEVADAAALETAEAGWYFDANRAGGTVIVNAGDHASSASSLITLVGTSAVGGTESDTAAMSIDVLVDDRVIQGASTEVRVTATNTGDHDKTDLTFSAQLPEGWTLAEGAENTVASLAPGASATATFTASPTTSAKAGLATINAEVTYTSKSGTAAKAAGGNQIDVVYGTFASAFDKVSITSLATRAEGDFDGDGATFSAEALADAGVDLGSTVNVELPGGVVDFTWPIYNDGEPNSVELNGQTIAVSGEGTHLAVLGSAASGDGLSPNLTITYTDGTSQTESLFFPNWVGDAAGTATVAIETMGRNNAKSPTIEYPTTVYSVFANTVRLNPGKTVASVTLPVENAVKFFDWKVVEQKLPEAPTGTVHVSDLEWTEMINGWGVVGKDVANKDDASAPDVPLVINTTDALKKTYEKGLGVHAVSKLTYYLGGQCTSFTSDIGLEDGFSGNVIFSVDLDGKEAYKGTTFQAGFPTEKVSVDVTDAQYIDLELNPTPGGSIDGAHGVWGEPTLVCSEAPEPGDTTAPVTTADLGGDPNAAGWFTARPTLSLTATDEVGVAETQYRLGEGAWNTYTEPVMLPEGETASLQYRSTDAADNVEEAHSLGPIRVDTAKPAASVEADGRTFVVTATDAGSGVASIDFSLDGGGTWTAYEAPVAAGSKVAELTARATDVAGNVSIISEPVRIEAEEGGNASSESIAASPEARAGGEVVVSFTGFAPGATGELWMHSAPVLLGSFVTDADGAATKRFTVPAGTPAGTHTLQALIDGTVVASTAFTVVGADSTPIVVPGLDPSKDGLASTGSSLDLTLPVTLSVGLLIAGAGLLLLRRRIGGQLTGEKTDS
ncbi:NPCBM/NEW2 domain-containing protein [Microbacterium foliorum]|uniref:NPCBM/NEW2 domain-containing protein n=1 Tax=Microbacterium foliorum TaxID=104336 RepID=UPI001E64FE47|nr:NPCBM/NEW2 domain-containing protein [Microbacterium foliorum]